MHHTWCLPGMWLHAMATWPYISLVFLLMKFSWVTDSVLESGGVLV